MKTIAEMVSEDATCAYYSKWYLGDEVLALHGFTEWVSTEDQYRAYYSDPAPLSRLSDYHHFLAGKRLKPDKEYLGQRVFSRQMAARSAGRVDQGRFSRKRGRPVHTREPEQPLCIVCKLP
jgi:hypothetical protein